MTSKIILAKNALDLALKEDGSDRLSRLKSAQDNLELAIRASVTSLKDEGATWTVIAELLGVSKQAAQERYGSMKPPG